MKTWADVQDYIQANGLSYKVERYNMSNRGTLVGLVSAQPFAYTVRDAARLLRSETEPFAYEQARLEDEENAAEEEKDQDARIRQTGRR